MRKMLKMSMAAAMVMGIGSVSSQADGIDILSNVKVKGEVRVRYENVDQNNALSNANALTNRLTLGVAADILGTDWLSTYAELVNVSSANDNYNSTDNGRTSHSVVADPDQTRLTQAYVDAKFDETNLRLGRQMINLDNQRFVGAVGWRQMFQTLDAYTLTNSTVENLNLFASYVTQINRVFAADATKNWNTKTLLLNAKYKVMDELAVTGYGYLISEGTGGAAGGSDTYGIALTGDIKADGVKVNYRAEYATQTDPTMENSGSTGNLKVDANYYNLELGMNMSGVLAGLRYEVLSGDSDGAGKEKAFSTPLATLHGQNGWADMFLGTPVAGLVDMNIMLGYKSKEIGLVKIVYHDFSSDVGSIDYGTEIDAVYTRAIPGVKNLTGTVKVANFNSDTVAMVDTTKFWLMLDYKFASN